MFPSAMSQVISNAVMGYTSKERAMVQNVLCCEIGSTHVIRLYQQY